MQGSQQGLLWHEQGPTCASQGPALASDLAPAASLSVADMSLDALQSAQEEDLLTLKLFRWGGWLAPA